MKLFVQKLEQRSVPLLVPEKKPLMTEIVYFCKLHTTYITVWEWLAVANHSCIYIFTININHLNNRRVTGQLDLEIACS